MRLFVLHNLANSPVFMHGICNFCIIIRFLLDYNVTVYFIIEPLQRISQQVSWIEFRYLLYQKKRKDSAAVLFLQEDPLHFEDSSVRLREHIWLPGRKVCRN